MYELILALLLTLPPYHRDHESSDARLERLQTIAHAIDSATLEATCSGDWAQEESCRPTWPGKRNELAALLITIGYHESAFARHVGDGTCLPHECDHGAARHYWQQHAGPWLPLEQWEELRGLAYVPTVSAARGAARHLGAGLQRCRSVGGAIAFYARSRCSWSGVESRLRTYRVMIARLQ